jgi:rhamnosyl/mannosyltransferase
VFVLAPYLAEKVKARGAHNVEVVPNGIDLADLGVRWPQPPLSYARATHEHTKAVAAAIALQSPLRMITVGRLSVEKGIEHLLAACRLLDIDYQLTIAGSGPLETHLRESAPAPVKFVGAVPRNTLGALYREHDVFVTATLSEAFALVILEALACGLPVIGTNIEALRAVIHHEENGLLVPPADPRALATAIERIARDEPLRQQFAANAHASVLPRYSWPAIGDQIAEIIRRMRA